MDGLGPCHAFWIVAEMDSFCLVEYCEGIRDVSNLSVCTSDGIVDIGYLRVVGVN